MHGSEKIEKEINADTRLRQDIVNIKRTLNINVD